MSRSHAFVPLCLRAAVAAALLAAGCESSPAPRAVAGDAGHEASGASTSDAATPEDAGVESGGACGGPALPVVQVVDAAAAARGGPWLTAGVLGQGYIPLEALNLLWIVWGTGQPADTAAYWQAFEARYGFFAAPFDNGGYPIGVRVAANGEATLDCLTCHASVVAGVPVIGVGNSRLDLQGLFDDLSQLRQEAKALGYDVPALPFTIEGRTAAAGANDAFGLGMYLSTLYDPAAAAGVHTTAGFQQAPAWWSLRYRNRLYLDGSGQAGGFRTMMATLLASGAPLSTLQSEEPDFADLYQYLLSLDAPCWTLTSLDPDARGRGESVYAGACASCHGTYGAGGGYPDRVVAASEVGTDPLRAASFGPSEAAWVDSSWFGGNGAAPYAMTSTGGYLAPPLVGVWATAPYFHNGSVPDLAGVLDSSRRPTRWRRTGDGATDYDPALVGWRYTEIDTPVGTSTISDRLVYDTAVVGLGNGGHTYGDALTESQRADLLEYLRSL